MALGVGVERIVITELRDRTFYAEIQMTSGGSGCKVSSRPSDAIALAVRLGSPIFADEAVLDEAAVPVAEDEEDHEDEVERSRELRSGGGARFRPVEGVASLGVPPAELRSRGAVPVGAAPRAALERGSDLAKGLLRSAFRRASFASGRRCPSVQPLGPRSNVV